MGSRQNRYLHRPRLARGDQSYLVTPPTTRAFLATRSAYTYLRAPSWISTYRVHPEFCAARAFRRDGRYFAGLQFSTPRVMHDGMDSRRNHIQADDTVQFVKAFCRCSDIQDSRIGRRGWTRCIASRRFLLRNSSFRIPRSISVSAGLGT